MDNNNCANCGVTTNLQRHHIVPRKFGGTDRPTNIVTLCGKCHCKAHRFINDHWENAKTGRKKSPAPQGYESALNDYFEQKIGRRELIERLGLKNNRITQLWWYKEYCDANGIHGKRLNHVDILASQSKRIESRRNAV